jgi:para-nitrobenzyl esterase
MKRILLLSLLAAGCGQTDTTQSRQTTSSADNTDTPQAAQVEAEASPNAALGVSKRLAAPQVQTPSGAVRGGINGTTHTFLGIPYALPPTGSRRFKKPEPFPAWTTRFRAKPLLPFLATKRWAKLPV